MIAGTSSELTQTTTNNGIKNTNFGALFDWKDFILIIVKLFASESCFSLHILPHRLKWVQEVSPSNFETEMNRAAADPQLLYRLGEWEFLRMDSSIESNNFSINDWRRNVNDAESYECWMRNNFRKVWWRKPSVENIWKWKLHLRKLFILSFFQTFDSA